MAEVPAHILVVLDPRAKHQPALDRAAWLAERTNATLELFLCDYEQDLSTSELFDAGALECARQHLLASHRQTLEGHAKRLGARGISAEIDVRWAHPLDTATEHKAAESGADLVLKHTRYHGELRRSLFSAADWNLIARCPVPLWLVKPRPVAARPSILAAIDPRGRLDAPGNLDDRILAAASGIQRGIGGALEVLHAFDMSSALAISPATLSTPIAAPVRELKFALMRKHIEAVHALTDRHGVSRDAVHVHEGPIRRLLVAWANELEPDVLVLGGASRSALPHRSVGSTAEQVLDEIPCDLLIVGPQPLAPAYR